MMKKLLIAGLVCLVVFTLSCERDDDDDDDAGGRSHNAGKNCLSCHKDFKMAGSVYNKALNGAYPAAKIKLTSQANGGGTVLTTLSSDQSGNFYTESQINFGTGVFVSVEGTTGTLKHMNASVTGGACNSCHGSSASKIWAE